MPHVNRLPGQRADAQLSSCYSFTSLLSFLELLFSLWSPPSILFEKSLLFFFTQTNSSGDLKILLGSLHYHAFPVQGIYLC